MQVKALTSYITTGNTVVAHGQIIDVPGELVDEYIAAGLVALIEPEDNRNQRRKRK